MQNSPALKVLSFCFGVVVSGGLSAANADICYGPSYSLLTPAPVATNSTQFSCPQAGQKTLPQLAAEGWQVVQMSPISLGNNQGADQLIIQRP